MSQRKRESARHKGTAPVEVKQTKKQIAYRRKEARQRRIILLSLAALIVVILAILATGLILELVVQPRAAVAMVNGSKVRLDEYQELLKLQRYNLNSTIRELEAGLYSLDPEAEGNDFLISFYQQQLAQLEATLAGLPDATLEELIEDKLIAEKATEVGLSVTAAEVRDSINQQLGEAAAQQSQEPISEAGEVETATPIPQQQLDEIYGRILANMGLSDKQFSAIMQRSLLRDKVQDLLASRVVTTGLVIHAQLIQVDAEGAALATLERIEGGEEFALVAQEVSSDTLTAESGGDLGWITTGQLSNRYGDAVEQAAFALEPGDLKVVENLERFYLIQVVGRDENGPLPEEVISQRQRTALTDWLAARREAPDVAILRLLKPEQIPADPFAAGNIIPVSSNP
jgi:parvulin-like peptidyl-prolyl isomerase